MYSTDHDHRFPTQHQLNRNRARLDERYIAGIEHSPIGCSDENDRIGRGGKRFGGDPMRLLSVEIRGQADDTLQITKGRLILTQPQESFQLDREMSGQLISTTAWEDPEQRRLAFDPQRCTGAS
jgi:hypothetical protein